MVNFFQSISMERTWVWGGHLGMRSYPLRDAGWQSALWRGEGYWKVQITHYMAFIDSANIIFRRDFQLMFHKIKECHYDRRRIEWQVLSSRSKDLIRKMLEYEHLRLTAKQCLSHEFMQFRPRRMRASTGEPTKIFSNTKTGRLLYHSHSVFLADLKTPPQCTKCIWRDNSLGW